MMATIDLGGAIGISMILAATVRSTSVAQSHLVEAIGPDNPLYRLLPDAVPAGDRRGAALPDAADGA
jgi:hypothetical protein